MLHDHGGSQSWPYGVAGGVLCRGMIAAALTACAVASAAFAAAVPAGATRVADRSELAGPATTIPPELRLPNESAPEWVTDEALTRPWEIDPCTPTAYPTDRFRTDARAVVLTIPEFEQVHQLVVYPTAAVAHEAMQGFRRVLAACRLDDPFVGDDGRISRITWDSAELGIGNEGLSAFARALDANGQRVGTFAASFAIIRRGTAIFLVSMSGETGDLRPQAASVAESFVGNMCVFTEGCD
jgi:hypothetical protein